MQPPPPPPPHTLTQVTQPTIQNWLLQGNEIMLFFTLSLCHSYKGCKRRRRFQLCITSERYAIKALNAETGFLR
jgi:hypothetical protein